VVVALYVGTCAPPLLSREATCCGCPTKTLQRCAPPPRRVMNWRRLRSSMGSPPGTRCASLPQAQIRRKRPQVLGVDLNRSESSRQPPFTPAADSWRTPPSPPRASVRSRALACDCGGSARWPVSLQTAGRRGRRSRISRALAHLRVYRTNQGAGSRRAFFLNRRSCILP
jgi:hypothetical protein